MSVLSSLVKESKNFFFDEMKFYISKIIHRLFSCFVSS